MRTTNTYVVLAASGAASFEVLCANIKSLNNCGLPLFTKALKALELSEGVIFKALREAEFCYFTSKS